MNNPSFSHVDATNRPSMVDVANKAVTKRTAQACALIRVPKAVGQALLLNGNHSKKGPVFDTAIIAGTMAVKRTADLIPFCHSLPIEACRIEIDMPSDTHIRINSFVATEGKTGVEMEALTAASISALTVYDMCKSMTHEMSIESVSLVAKTGGKKDYFSTGL